VLLFTGKGGVGKTSVAAATAVRAASRGGARVLVTSTDPAHSLADALDAPLGDRPSAVRLPGPRGGGRLHAHQIDAQQRLEDHWGAVREYLVALLAWGGVGQVEAEELLLLPGLDELFALLDLRVQVTSGRYDLVVVDCAPTAETLKLLSLPEALRWYADRVLGGRRLGRAVLPLTRTLGPTGAPLPAPGPDVLDQVGRVHDELAAVHTLLRDPARASVRLVLAPERLSVAEAQRTATSVGLFGYAIDAVVVNRLLPDEVTDPYLAGWRRRHAQHLAEVRAGFAPTPVLTAPLVPDEPIGVSALAALGDALYGERDERAVLHDRPALEVRDGEDGRVVRVALPFATGDDLELHRRGDAVTVRVGSAKRTIPLPAAVAREDIAGARLTDGWLELRFAPASSVVPS
jgi:arsenite/tail-anchored protein-transporting ATPase